VKLWRNSFGILNEGAVVAAKAATSAVIPNHQMPLLSFAVTTYDKLVMRRRQIGRAWAGI